MWHQLWLGGELFPGVAKLSGKGIARKLDKQNPKGAAGARLIDEGDELAEFDIALRLWEDEQQEQLLALLPSITPRRKGGPKRPLEIYHPTARVLGIQNIYIEQIPFPDHDWEHGHMLWKFKCTEWVPAPKPQAKGKGGGAGKSPKTGSDAEEKSALEQYAYDLGKTVDEIIDQVAGGNPENTGWNGLDAAGTEQNAKDEFGD